MQATGGLVVTPEAVALDVQTAALGSRVFARAIDIALQASALGIIFSAALANHGTVGIVLAVLAGTAIGLGYPIILESLWRGKTVGKAALGVRVVTNQGAPLRFRHALVRGLVGLVEVLSLPVVGILALLLSPRDQRLGDLAAGTIVIRERSSALPSRPVYFYPPPGCEAYVGTVDVSSMADDEYETVRSFLLRAREMEVAARGELAMRLAVPLAHRWRQAVPPGMWPELWLACVASAYQQRHGFFPPPASPPSPGGWLAPAGPVPMPPPAGVPLFPPPPSPPGAPSVRQGDFAPPD